MGETFVNVHIRAGGSDAAALQGRVVAALRARVTSGPWREAVAGSDGDRTIRVAPPETGWISVYDDELQVSEELAPFCADLSRVMATWVVGAEVLDSDYLYMVLARKGSVVDEFHSMPDYGEPVSEERRRALAGRPEVWRPLLVGADPASLREAWDAHELRADEQMAQVARILGIPSARSLAGPAHPDLVYDPDSVSLKFESTALTVAPEDLPVLQEAGSNDPSTARVGSEIDVEDGVKSVGPAGTGLIVLISGDVLKSNIAELGSVTVEPLTTTDDLKIARLGAAELLPGGPGNETGRLANFAELLIPRGSRAQAHGPRVQIRIKCRTLRSGTGTLEVMAFPTENFMFGGAQFSIPIEVIAE